MGKEEKIKQMKYILLLLFIAFAGLKSRPGIRPCTKEIERTYYYNGKKVASAKDEYFQLSFSQNATVTDKPSGKRFIADSVTFKMYQPK